MTNKTKFGSSEATKAFADEAEDIIKEKDTNSATYRQKAMEPRKCACKRGST